MREYSFWRIWTKKKRRAQLEYVFVSYVSFINNIEFYIRIDTSYLWICSYMDSRHVPIYLVGRVAVLVRWIWDAWGSRGTSYKYYRFNYDIQEPLSRACTRALSVYREYCVRRFRGRGIGLQMWSHHGHTYVRVPY